MSEAQHCSDRGLRGRVHNLGHFDDVDAYKTCRDKMSRHISDADEAISLGSIDQDGGNPYMNTNLLVQVAVEAKADAVHPGYGYLSENAEFADAVRRAGLSFIGPSSKAMSTLGDKRTAKDYLRQHEPSIPLIPGFADSSQDVTELEIAAKKIGFPVMLKASAGGGGKGMRIVRETSKLQEELERARSEAARSFGSEDCILEKYIEAGKHIEIQIIGDSHGNVISLWERECSIQRRHQKVIEETPSPWMTAGKRKEMSDVAIRIGKLLNYENAGTIEFVVDITDGRFYFLEVNTRLQVEHPITEEVTGIDIVSLQLFVTAGGNLGDLPVLRQIPQDGCAIECRLCAEDPQNDFFPEHGTVRQWRPASIDIPALKDARFETAIATGSRISIYFDSMIAKIVVWAPTRSMAIQKMVKTLSYTVCAGLKTNQSFLQSCLQDKNFQDPSYTTSFISNNLAALLQPSVSPVTVGVRDSLVTMPALFLRCVGQYINSISLPRPFQQVRLGFRNQHYDPVGLQSGIVTSNTLGEGQKTVMCEWETSPQNSRSRYRVTTKILNTSLAVADEWSRSAVSQATQRYNEISKIKRNGGTSQGNAYDLVIESCDALVVSLKDEQPWVNATLAVSINGISIRAYIATAGFIPNNTSATSGSEGEGIFCHFPLLGTSYEYKCYNLLSFCESMRASVVRELGGLSKTIVAPMPCKVLSVLKSDGDNVAPGETVMVIESMKMEMAMSMPQGGKFKTIIRKGDSANEGSVLCRVE